MAITNEPILLDSTGRDILAEMRRQNGYLAMLAEGRRGEMYTSMSQIASIVRANDLATNRVLFPVGDQLIMPWKDMDDPAHDTDETAYQVAWDIVSHQMVELQDGRTVPGMFLQTHFCTPFGMQFSNYQAFKDCPDGLPAGTYHVTFGGKLGSNGANANTSWQFTLTQPVPAGGRLSGFERLADIQPSQYTVKSWATPGSDAPIETVSVVAGTGGTNLGTVQATAEHDGLNSMQRMAYGHNRWSTSAVRQYLNGQGTNWWASAEPFDIRPDNSTKHGWMSGLDSDFLAAIKPVKVLTMLNTAEWPTPTVDETFDMFFIPSSRQVNSTSTTVVEEELPFAYWREKLGASDLIASGDNPERYDAYKIKPFSQSSSAKDVRLRNARSASANCTTVIKAAGYVHSYAAYASTTMNLMPVCVVC